MPGWWDRLRGKARDTMSDQDKMNALKERAGGMLGRRGGEQTATPVPGAGADTDMGTAGAVGTTAESGVSDMRGADMVSATDSAEATPEPVMPESDTSGDTAGEDMSPRGVSDSTSAFSDTGSPSTHTASTSDFGESETASDSIDKERPSSA